MPVKNKFTNTMSVKPLSQIEVSANSREDHVRRRDLALACWRHLEDCITTYPGRGLRSFPAMIGNRRRR